MKKITILLFIVVSTSCKTSKNYVASDEKYEVINLLGEKYGKQKKLKVFYKTYVEGTDDWEKYINFDQFSLNVTNQGLGKINFEEFLSNDDLVFMRKQVNQHVEKKWIKSKLSKNIILNKNREQKSMILNMFSEPVSSMNKEVALVYWFTGGSQINVYIKENKQWKFLCSIMVSFS